MRKFLRYNPAENVQLQMEQYQKDLQDYFQELNESSDQELTEEGRAGQLAFFNEILTQTQQFQTHRLEIIQEAINRIPSWDRTQIIIKPHYFSKSWRSYSLYSKSPFDPIFDTNVRL